MKCIYKKDNGERCNADAMNGSEYCYWHSPEISPEERREAQARGGQAGKIKVKEPLEPIKIDTTKDVLTLITDSINRIRNGTMDVKLGNTLGYLAGTAIKALEISELERRLETIEKHLTEQEKW